MKIKKDTRKVPVTVTKEHEVVVVELSPEEATTLLNLVWAVRWNNSPEGCLAYQVCLALENEGFVKTRQRERDSGYTTFKDVPR